MMRPRFSNMIRQVKKVPDKLRRKLIWYVSWMRRLWVMIKCWRVSRKCRRGVTYTNDLFKWKIQMTLDIEQHRPSPACFLKVYSVHIFRDGRYHFLKSPIVAKRTCPWVGKKLCQGSRLNKHICLLPFWSLGNGSITRVAFEKMCECHLGILQITL